MQLSLNPAAGVSPFMPRVTEKVRVVLVEDSQIIRARLIESLSEISNIEIVGLVDTEADALAILLHSAWNVAVLDLQLKRGTGLGVLKALAKGVRPANTKILVFTNYAFPQYRDRSLALGADYFFDKARDLQRVRVVLASLAGGTDLPELH
jgi:DNA-binding NarL/FixJ family response regulator